MKIVHPKPGREVKLKPVEWPVTRTQITLTLGKGGVAKTMERGMEGGWTRAEMRRPQADRRPPVPQHQELGVIEGSIRTPNR